MGDHERCDNCRRDIPAANYRMHSLHCARNIALCAACDEPVPRGELEEHQQEFHSTKHCPDCGAAVEAAKLEEHKVSLCLRRVEICKYCALSQEVGELKEHMEYCGSRTEKCEECKEIIMLRNWEMHIDSNHGFIKLKDEPGPKPSWEMAEDMKKRNNQKCDYMSSLYSTRPDPRYDDPRMTSTTTQRKNFTDTELFNNQDIYSSKRFATSTSAAVSSSTNGQSTSTSSVLKSASSSIVSSALQRSTSSTRLSSMSTMERRGSSTATERRSSIITGSSSASERRSSVTTSTERRSSVKTDESTGYSCLSKNTASIVAKVLANNKDVANAHVNGQTVEEEKLPCEFCEAMIPMYKLHSHQAECVNSSNVRGSGYTSYSRYSGLGRASSMRETSATRETSSSFGLDRSATSSRVNRYLRQASTETPAESETPPSVNGASPNRKVSPPNGSIVNRFVTGSDQRKLSNTPDSPPSYDKEHSYNGRSSYLKEERARETRRSSTTTKPKPQPVVAGLYENDQDRESLRQALNGLRKCPMDYADDPDNNDGSHFPCEFCGDPYPCEFLMRHQMSCDLNPQPVSSGNGFDYNSIKNSIMTNVDSRKSSVAVPSVVPDKRGSVNDDDERTEQILQNTRRLSRCPLILQPVSPNDASLSMSNPRASGRSRFED